MKKILAPFKYFIDLLYPQVCDACGNPLVDGEQLVCSYCRYEIPLTNFWNSPDNPAAELFLGKVELEQVSSFFYFTKSSRYRQLMHKLKYKGRKDIGVFLGRLYGKYLSESSLYGSIDVIIPLPLHPKRQAKRGYNQSEEIAKGIGMSMEKPIITDVLQRNVYAETQTNKNRMERWKNVENVFSVINRERLSGRHVLLVDDILTTGATLETCANAILKEVSCKISIATLAFAVY
ncbi:MAG: ComF family protein [Prevotellaceae bacterium]|jgi:ComF family protein|nr:ComF family protein [Prevotellaceae bacterium]